MSDGLFNLIVFGKPVACSPVQFGDLIRRALFAQHSFEETSKKMMIPKPIPFVVQGHDKQIGVYQPLDELFDADFRFPAAFVASCLVHFAAQGRTEAFQD